MYCILIAVPSERRVVLHTNCVTRGATNALVGQTSRICILRAEDVAHIKKHRATHTRFKGRKINRPEFIPLRQDDNNIGFNGSFQRARAPLNIFQ